MFWRSLPSTYVGRLNVIQVNVTDTFIPSNSEFAQARFSHPKDGGSTFPQNVGLNLHYTVQEPPKRQTKPTKRCKSRRNVRLNLYYTV